MIQNKEKFSYVCEFLIIKIFVGAASDSIV